MKTKTCPDCMKEKYASFFHAKTNSKDGLQAYCKICQNLRNFAWAKANPDRFRRNYTQWMKEYRERNREQFRGYDLKHRITRHGWTVAEYESVLAAQNGVCAICGKPENGKGNRGGDSRALAIDHDHSCCNKKYGCKRCKRGLLCAHCNHALHSIDADPEWPFKAVAYLNKFQCKKIG